LQEGGKIVLVLEWVYDEDMGKKGALKQLAGIGKQLKHMKHKVFIHILSPGGWKNNCHCVG
jgi:hypothetical protein